MTHLSHMVVLHRPQANLSCVFHCSRLMALKRMGIVDDYEVCYLRVALFAVQY